MWTVIDFGSFLVVYLNNVQVVKGKVGKKKLGEMFWMQWRRDEEAVTTFIKEAPRCETKVKSHHVIRSEQSVVWGIGIEQKSAYACH